MKCVRSLLVAGALVVPATMAAQDKAATPEAVVGTWTETGSNMTVTIGADSTWQETIIGPDDQGVETEITTPYRWRMSGDTLWWRADDPSAEWNANKVTVAEDGQQFSLFAEGEDGWAGSPTWTYRRKKTSEP